MKTEEHERNKMSSITMDELLEKLLNSAAATNQRIDNMGTKLESRMQEVMKEAVDPIKNRLDTVESNIADLKAELSNLKKSSSSRPAEEPPNTDTSATAMDAEKAGNEAAASWAQVSAMTTPPPSLTSSPGGNNARQRRMYLEESRRRKIGLDKDMMNIMEKASRTIAFCPIQSEEVSAIQKEIEESGAYGSDVKEEAMRKAIMEYQMGEMKLTEEECLEQDIVEVFAPKQSDFRTVYAVFASLEEAEKVLRMCVYLQHHNRVSHHVPWRARDRQNALEGRAKGYRERGFRTRIIIKDADYTLLVKQRVGDGGWRPATDSEDLPPFASAMSSRPADNNISPSQARGRVLRVGLKKHPRSPASESAEVPKNKKIRASPIEDNVDLVVEVTVEDCVDEEDITATGDKDRGMFTSVQSASPAKVASRRVQMSREIRNLQ